MSDLVKYDSKIDGNLNEFKLRQQNMIDLLEAEIISKKAAADTILRNQFAAAALTGFLSGGIVRAADSIELSFACADLMLAESKK